MSTPIQHSLYLDDGRIDSVLVLDSSLYHPVPVRQLSYNFFERQVVPEPTGKQKSSRNGSFDGSSFSYRRKGVLGRGPQPTKRYPTGVIVVSLLKELESK